MQMEDLPPKNISLGRFTLLAGSYLLITLIVFSILFRSYSFDLSIGVERVLQLVFMAFVAYKLQAALSKAYGGGRVIDWLASLPMLIVTGVAFLLWLNIPVIQSAIMSLTSNIGLEIAFAPDEYQRTAMFLLVWEDSKKRPA